MKIDIRGELETGVEVHSHTDLTREEVIVAIASLAYLFGEDQAHALDLLRAASALTRMEAPKAEIVLLNEPEPESLS